MKIKRRTFLILGFSLIGMIVFVWIIVGRIVAVNFGKLELKKAEEHARRVEVVFRHTLIAQDAFLYDWSAWDDTYYFVKGENDEYVESNLMDETMVGLNLNFMIFGDDAGQIVKAKFIDLTEENETVFPSDIVAAVSTHTSLLSHEKLDGALGGVLVTPYNTFLVSSRPVIQSGREGPIAGTLVFGRLFDQSMVEELSERSLSRLSVYYVNNSDHRAQVEEVLPFLPSDGAIHIIKTSEEQISGFIRINDLDGRVAVILRVDDDRDIYSQGKALGTVLVLSVVLISAVIFLIILVLLDTQIVSKLTFLQKKIHDVSREGDTSIRVAVSGADEMVLLAESFNRMLDTIHEDKENLNSARQAAESANQLKSEFLSNVSHEIRTPLNSILGFGETIMRLDDINEIREKMGIILQEGETLLQLINTLLDHAKIESGKMEMEVTCLNVRKIIDSVKTVLQEQVRKKGISFNVNIGRDVPIAFLGDPFRLRQIILNLTSNAVKFTSEGHVTLSVQYAGVEEGSVRLKFLVEDTGIGISPEDQAKIFKPFVQADGSTTRQYGGTGLGLVIAKKLVGLMGGELLLSSEPGKGTTSSFELRVKACQDAELTNISINDNVRVDGVMVPRDLSGKRILFAEDYEPNQKLVSLYLMETGAIVDIVSNGEDAVAACDRQYYDLIIMDIQMPKMDGYQAMRMIRQEGRRCRDSIIVIMTANAGVEARHSCVMAGAAEVIIKPIRKNTFLNIICSLIRQGQSGESGLS